MQYKNDRRLSGFSEHGSVSRLNQPYDFDLEILAMAGPSAFNSLRSIADENEPSMKTALTAIAESFA